ncbi:UPF0149 family protein [methanotrophic endosymbiont of Bathymodiolus puteoserpentis (Logatchev)]|jgi:uncharacterized protein YgfB (UPF0149 family)|uniref:UPF0149 family protein n=1 Tax=methanotrophic endosymbiont of Bathymodiolus puteoserpentis (Logatchev) TaxID=343235 RepID=UPI0013C549C9|nr:UPF0149 family protein [methanotrophic endosymbiont of Bathymodiolus puteoserpentis (Logatchev)]SHE20962.1 FIG001590: Putative conserved exported protein precursor [methanotrophic endosymbiont of Bathymodiolus puteoserpentis (Logatchev)]
MSYSEVNSIILQRDAAESAAEVHGIATAMLCLDSAAEASSWMTEAFFEDAHLLEEDKYALINLFDETKALLAGDEFLFDLYLPEDEEASLTVRCTALIQWCRGFLFGLGRASNPEQWSSGIQEILKDIVEFTKLDTDIEEGDDEAEGSLVEIQEYLRASTMLIRTELTDIVQDVANNKTLH